MTQGIAFKADNQRSLAAGSVSVGYAAIGSPFAHPMRQIIVQNYTDVLLQFSFDGINPHFVLPSGGQLILDVTANQLTNSGSGGWFIGIGTQMSVEQIGAPTTGSVYVSAFYAVSV